MYSKLYQNQPSLVKDTTKTLLLGIQDTVLVVEFSKTRHSNFTTWCRDAIQVTTKITEIRVHYLLA